MDNSQNLQFVLLLIFVIVPENVICMSPKEKNELRERVLEMFHHGYRSYMDFAYPADELMPLSCKGRYRGTEPSRGDVDDTLGNFSLTLIDTLDTLVVLGELDEFEKAVKLVINGVNFDTDIVVSVFETNIRVLGGLLGGHVMARYLKSRKKGMEWYRDELLEKAKDIGYRLLPAFNTTTGMPYPRINLRYGVKHDRSRTGSEKDTCTACAGTMILEFSALSRLSGDPIFEEKAHAAMEYLWHSRHRSSDLVGTVINIHNGDWVRRDSGVGAGIDSYYEYVLKAYILLGDETYLDRFNKHYAAIRKYVTQGPMLVDVHMHKPFTNSRNFMDALLAFWPGLLTLIGDMKPAIETHEMLYQVIQRHSFLPEAFTTDFRVHWAQHPLRPEFLESTYFLYKATGDSHYLEVGKEVLENLNSLARVKCGFAAIKDVTSGSHEDQMDSYVLAETFKYLYLLFSEPDDLVLNIDDFIFTTEAHLLPLSLSIHNISTNGTKMPNIDAFYDEDKLYEHTCPNVYLFESNYVKTFRDPLKNMVDSSCPSSQARCRAQVLRPPFAKTTTTSSCRLNNHPRLKASEFVAGNKIQLETLAKMGISVMTMKDGRVQLLHTASEAASSIDAEDGMLFMQEMIELSRSQSNDVQHEPRVVQFMIPPYDELQVLHAGPAQFGYDLKKKAPIKGKLTVADPIKGCQMFNNLEDVRGHIVILERGDCMFVDKARQLQEAGAIGGLVIDNHEGTSSSTLPLFAMSGDGKNDVSIPLLFLFYDEGQKLLKACHQYEYLQVYLGYESRLRDDILQDLLTDEEQRSIIKENSDIDLSDVHKVGGVEIDLLSESTPLVEEPTVDIVNDEDSFIQMITGPSNTKRVRLHLDKVKPSKGNLELVVEKLVSQLIEFTNFPLLEDNEKYLVSIAKMLDAIAENNYNLIDVESLNNLEKLNMLLKPKEKSSTEEKVSELSPTMTFKERLVKQMEGVLDEYISTELKKIIREASSFKNNIEIPEVSDMELGAPKVKEDNSASDAMKEANDYGLVQPGGKFEKGGGEHKRYLPPNVVQAPDWLPLESGQVIVAKDGNIYADLKDTYWDWTRDDVEESEREDNDDSGFESDSSSDSKSELFLSAYSTESGTILKSKAELDSISTDDPDNWDLELAVFENAVSEPNKGEDITEFAQILGEDETSPGQRQLDSSSQISDIRDSREHLSDKLPSGSDDERTNSRNKEEL